MARMVPARMPIRTYNRDFDVPRRQAQLSLFEHGLEQRPLYVQMCCLGHVQLAPATGGHPKVKNGARDWRRMAEEEVVPVAVPLRRGS